MTKEKTRPYCQNNNIEQKKTDATCLKCDICHKYAMFCDYSSSGVMSL